jgi:superfamily II DNA/RNA helicase
MYNKLLFRKQCQRKVSQKLGDKMKFSDFTISDEVLKALDKLDYDSPMEVQEQVIPLVMQGRDLIVKSQTGSGKTAAFAIPLCEKVQIEEKKPQALILAPTRELALQIKEDVQNIGRFKKVRATALYGRHPIDLQKRELRQRVHIVVGTPGRTMDHIERGTLDISSIKYLIIDEADEMLNMGFIDQVEGIIKTLPPNRVTLLFSATMPERIEEICNVYMKDSKNIEITSSYTTHEKIQQYYYKVHNEDKISVLMKIIDTEKTGSSILFCNTREKAEEIGNILKKNKYSCAILHGGMTQRERFQTINAFKKGEVQFLVATDVAARGIDVEDITHVINYEVPYERENHVHRIGRTGRKDNKGVAISLVSEKESRRFEEIEDYLGYKIEKFSLESLQEAFEESVYSKPKRAVIRKTNKAAKINKEITRIRINAGKKKKIRPGDIMGALTHIEGIEADQIGIIDVQDTCTYVEIFEGKGMMAFKGLQNSTIKGKKFTMKIVN